MFYEEMRGIVGKGEKLAKKYGVPFGHFLIVLRFLILNMTIETTQRPSKSGLYRHELRLPEGCRQQLSDVPVDIS